MPYNHTDIPDRSPLNSVLPLSAMYTGSHVRFLENIILAAFLQVSVVFRAEYSCTKIATEKVYGSNLRLKPEIVSHAHLDLLKMFRAIVSVFK